MSETAVKPLIVGQGPNQTAWQHGLNMAAHWRKSRESGKLTRTDEEVAEDYCRRVAITGTMGRKLAALLDLDMHGLIRLADRANLNARFNGKDGKGDVFNFPEGKRRADLLLESKVVKVVCLGQAVAKCFDFQSSDVPCFRETYVYEQGAKRDRKVTFLLFPHPSGINTWWNEEFNRFRARKALREFLL